MRNFLKRAKQQGFTLVELMIVVAIVGVLAVLAVYGVRKYLANAKTAEARNSLGQLSKDAATAVEREKGTTAIITPGSVSALMRQFCDTSLKTVPSGASSIQGQKYQSTAAEWNDGSPTVGWQCLKFTLEEPQYFMYNYSATGTDGNSGGFVATANGDLNGNGATSVFSVTGSSFSGAVAISPNVQETDPEE